MRGRIATVALLLLPGAATVYLSFNAGGFFPNTVAFVACAAAAVLILRIGFAEAPFEGLSRPVMVAGGALLLYAAWTMLSALWSDATSRALIEFDRALLYVLVLVLFGSIPRTPERLQWLLRGLAAAIVVVGTIALTTRVLPDLWPTSADIANDRLSFPLTYWNALGLLVGLGSIFCAYLTTSLRESRVVRALAAAPIPVLATTLLFTFSRGAIAATIVGVVAYVVVARPRGLLAGLLAVVPPTAFALVTAYDADLLATTNPTTPAAVDQGEHVAAVVAACVVAAGLLRVAGLFLDARLERLKLPRVGRPALAAAAAVTVAAAISIAVVLNAPESLGDQYDRFVHGTSTGNPADFRTRLTNPANNGRLDQWEVALDAFERSKLDGTGAGTYELEWAEHRPNPSTVTDTHSLYAEVLGELGVVGFVLLMIALGTIIVGAALGARGRHRSVYAAVFAASLAWAIHAGVDWDWEMPAVTLWLFAAGGLVLARPETARPPWWSAPSLPFRLGAILACAAFAVVPALIFVSQSRLDDSLAHFNDRECVEAIDSARSATSVLDMRPEPYEVMGYCEVWLGNASAGVVAMREAIDRDPDNWEYHQGLAIARAGAGLDPRQEARKALRLNPLEPSTIDTARRLRGTDRRRWRRQARALVEAALE